MIDIREKVENEFNTARQVRDELRLQVHLANAELREQWDKLEGGWQHLEGRLKVLGNESDDVAEEVGETLHVLAEQLSEGYRRIKTLI
ncbi:MAG: chromosome segregation ATPase [Myxococcota bacterium]|jgi:chromosome segregation ATPase